MPTGISSVDARRRPGDAVAEREAAPLALAGAELDDLARAPARGRPERREGGDDLHDDLVGVEEDDVDREPHERRVDRPGGAEQHPVTRREVALSEEAAQSPQRRVGDDDGVGDDAPVLPPQRQVRDGPHRRSVAQRTFMMLIITGSSRTMKSEGMISRRMGKSTFTGAFCARSSA